MVSFWPWRGDASSTADFEKTLSALSAKITDTQARLDSTRSRSRRIRVLWTIYLSFAYLVYAIVMILVVGSHKMGPYEWTSVASGPLLIYVTRRTLTTYYNYRIDSLGARLEEQQAERTKTIQKLKDATKYDSTLELLEKYGGPDARPRSRRGASSADEDEDGHHRGGKGPHQTMGGQARPGRTNMPPPPTANIQRRPEGPHTPHDPHPLPQLELPRGDGVVPVTEEFAPNAFSHSPPPPETGGPPHAPTQYETQGGGGGGSGEAHWYDRILDLLLGEDETAAKNRIVLICRRCRLVNGQAPPGTKALSEVGVWKCMACGTANGEMDEGKKIVREVLEARKAEGKKPEAGREEGKGEESEDGDGSDGVAEVGKVDGTDEGRRLRKRKGKK